MYSAHSLMYMKVIIIILTMKSRNWDQTFTLFLHIFVHFTEKESSKKYSRVLIIFHEVTLKLFKNFLIPHNWLNLQEYKLQFTLVFYEFPKLRAMRVSVPTCLVFQHSLSTCQKACQFFKYSPFEMLSEISILYYIKNYTWYHSYTYMYMYRT